MDRAPSQDIYRSDDEWSVAQQRSNVLLRIPPHHYVLYRHDAHRNAGGDDFEYIDASGHPITEQNRERHDSQILDNFLALESYT